MDAADRTDLVRQAQVILADGGADIRADGKWGGYTMAAYNAASPEAREAVNSLLGSAGTSATALFDARKVQKRTAAVQLEKAAANPAATALRPMIASVAQEAGISPDTLLAMAKIESNFNPNAVNGSSRGLFQFQPPAWKDANTFLRGALPPYAEGVFNPLANARAAAAYIKINTRSLLARPAWVGPITPAVLYMAHQQGVGGLKELQQRASDPTRKARLVPDRALLGNPPQDGQGPTTDPAQFLKRWLAVVERKMAS